MASYADKYTLSLDAALKTRLQICLIEKSNYFLALPGTDAQQRLANGILLLPNRYLDLFMREIAVNGTATAAAIPSPGTIDSSLIDDSTIDSVVSAVWDRVAASSASGLPF